MTLIKSISGIRGTIGGKSADNLTPVDIVKFTAAYGYLLKVKNDHKPIKIVVGRDARSSGEMLNCLVCGTLIGLGINILNIGLATTPTTEIAVKDKKAHGGIILTASHNPQQWNALKLLNDKGEFLSAEMGKAILKIIETEDIMFAGVDELGKVTTIINYVNTHIRKIISLSLVDVEAIRKAHFTVVVDAVNSVGGIAIPKLLKKLGVKNIIALYCEPNGQFPHLPEPLPENLTEIAETVVKKKADLGFVVDPDADRLAIVNEDGTMFGEEYTLVAIADYVLSKKPGNTVSNLSSTRALCDVTKKYGGEYHASAVGEVNVVAKMKAVNAVIGGEGNGGIIYPENHYGRDALAGIALFLSFLAKTKIKCSALRKLYPSYYISKNKMPLPDNMGGMNKIFEEIIKLYPKENIDRTDGLKINFVDEWVHLRKSNTEPIIRIYAESNSEKKADELANKIIQQIKNSFRENE